MICLDTTAIIDFYRGDENLKKLLDSLEGTFATTIVNYQEIFFGINLKDTKHNVEEEYYEDFFDDIIIFDLDRASAKNASEILLELVHKGKIIEKFDCMIAGILLSNGVNKIITKNKKHFKNIKGLKVISY
ncbi:MAG: type II toxin-antitoxin system VapC family toxin [Candidatus Pacearchaeota archaeon]